MEPQASTPRHLALLVTGVHRSGTSALARGALALGLEMGENFIEAQTDNPTGFWEDREMVKINRNLLALLGGDINHNLVLVGPQDWDEEILTPVRKRIRQFIANKVPRDRYWAAKDPRLCLTFPLWRQLLEEAGKECACVFAVRNPLGVAQSLKARNGFTLEQGMLLWLEYIYSFATNVGLTPTLVVAYESLLQGPRDQLHRLAAFLGINILARESQVEEYCSSFLDPFLQHQAPAIEDLRSFCASFPEILSIYSALTEAAAASDPKPSNFWKDLTKSIAGLQYAQKIVRNISPAELVFARRENHILLTGSILEANSNDQMLDRKQHNPTERTCSFNLPHGRNTKFKLILGDKPCCVRVTRAQITGIDGSFMDALPARTNANVVDSNLFLFDSDRPELLYDIPAGSVEIHLDLTVEAVGQEAEVKILHAVQHELKSARKKFAELEHEISLLHVKLKKIYAESEAAKSVAMSYRLKLKSIVKNENLSIKHTTRT